MSEFWFGNLPERWSARGSRSVLAELVRRDMPDAEMLSVTIANGVVPQKRYLELAAAKKDQSNIDRSKYKYLEPGDLAYNKMRAWQGAAGCSAFFGIVSPAYVVLRTLGGNDSRFFGYLMRTPLFAREAERWSYGITSDQWSLRPADFKKIWFPVPPLDEQRLIVRYLDDAELRIARAIQAKQVLLGFLAERREVTVTNLVLGSTNAGAEETWFGSLPAEWQVLPARALFRERIERGQPDLPLLSVTIKSGVMLQSDYLAGSSKRDQSNVDRSSYKVARPGDIVYNKMRAWQGAAGLSRHLGVVSPAYVVQTPQVLLNPAYAEAVMRTGSFAKEAERLSYGITSDQWSLRPQHFKQILFPVPPRLEQDRICVALDTATRDIDAASDSLQREIDLLREYRIRLISDVVTGKKDVRSEASGMKDVDPVELAEALAGVTSAGNDELGEEDDAE